MSVRLDKQWGQQWARNCDMQEVDIRKDHALRMRHVRHQHVARLQQAACPGIAANEAPLSEEMRHVVVDPVAGDAEAGAVKSLGCDPHLPEDDLVENDAVNPGMEMSAVTPREP